MRKETIQVLKDLGLNLIPCQEKSKMPSISWKPFQTKRYTGTIPEKGNAAVICGRMEGCQPLMVLDLDSPELADMLFDDWERVLNENLVVQTGSGGYHIYVKPRKEDSTLGKRLTNNKGHHMDIQGDGTYVIAPSSIHPNGNEYKIISSTTNIKEVNMTGFISSLSKHGFNTGGSGLPSTDEIAKGVQAGMINDSAFKYSCHLLSRVGLDKETAWYELKEWLKRCTTENPDERKLRSVFDHAVQRVERDGLEVNKDKVSEEEIPQYKSKTEWIEWLTKFIGDNKAVDEINKKFVLNIDNKILQHMVKRYPASFIEMVKIALEEYGIDVRIELTMNVNTTLRGMKPELRNEIVCFEADVMAVEDRKTYTKSADFKCDTCGAIERLESNEYHIIPTEKCGCRKKPILGIIENDEIESDFTQNIYIRESMAEAKHGSPITMKCRIFGDMVGEAFVGQRKTIIGQMRSLPTGKRNLNEVVIDVLSITALDEIETRFPTDDEMKEWKEKIINKEFFDELCSKEFAPDIIGNLYLKKALFLSLIGAPKTRHKVNNIHALMLGDPGTSKTTLMERLQEISPKSVFTTGRGTSAAGLTGGMDRIGPNMPLIFLPGAVTVANKGVVYADEIDKMEDHDRDSILTCMAKGYVPINKVGIVGAILPADTTIIASANPKGGRPWIMDKPVVNQTNLTLPFLSRCDVVWLVRDEIDEYRDKKISNHIMSQMNASTEKLQNCGKLLRYINYVKTLNPELTEDAQKKITEFYVQLRKLAVEKTYVPVDPRKTESIAKLAMAHARLMLKETADVSDVEVALELMESSLNSFGLSMQEGKSQSQYSDFEKLNKEDSVLKCIEESKDEDGNFKLGDVTFRMLQLETFENAEQARRYLNKWEDRVIFYNGDGTYRM